MNMTTTPRPTFDLTPTTLQEAMDQANMLAGSGIIPKQFQNKPQDILVAIQMGLEVGLKPLQALKNIAVINGTPTIWGDSAIALVRKSPICEYIIETVETKNINDRDILVGICRVKRRGEEEQIRTFDQVDAEIAGLWGRNVWKNYPKRMIQMRARSWALRDVFPDVLGGFDIAEEVQDKQEKEINARGTDKTENQRQSSLNDLASGKKPKAKPKAKKEKKPDPVLTIDQDGEQFSEEQAEEFLNDSVNEIYACQDFMQLKRSFGVNWSELKAKGFEHLADKLKAIYEDKKDQFTNV